MKPMMFGVLLIIGGVLFIIGSVFGINFPIIRILMGILVIYFGIKIITGGSSSSGFRWEAKKISTDNQAVFSESTFAYPNEKGSSEYTTVFAESKLDLTPKNSEDLVGKKIKYVTVFAESEIILKKDMPVRISAETVIGNTNILQKTSAVIGKQTYQTPNLKDSEPALEIEVVTVFGQVKVKAQE